MRIVKVPEHRIAAVIGEKGSTKKMIEDKCHIMLNIHSDGSVEIMGEEDSEFFAESVIKAIARGFSAWDAIKLSDPDYVLFIIDLREYVHTRNSAVRLKSRVIGREGRIKMSIEHATDSILSIQGHTISIIAKYDAIEYAQKAIDMLLNGSRHATVETYLSQARKDLFENRISGKSVK